MGYMTDGLTFNTLRGANIARLPEFRNSKGELTHPNGVNDWTIPEWSNAVFGEGGEAANIIKKIHRGDLSLDEARASLADELADIITYIDLLALRAGIDLGSATMKKFNEVSERVGSSVRIAADDWHRASKPNDNEKV